METKYFRSILIALIFIAVIITTGYGQTAAQGNKQKPVTTQNQTVKYKVTFIELGSVRCIPCQKMQPVMQSIRAKYPKQVNVIFYDVWTPEGKPFGQQYGIQAISTQIFLDENGKEFFRHEGFFSEKELVKILKTKGVTEN